MSLDAAAADQVAQAALSTPGVVGLGGPREVATYLPGRQVHGVRRTDQEVEVHVVVDWSEDLRSVATAVQRAVEATGHRPVHVFVEDVRVPGEEGAQT